MSTHNIGFYGEISKIIFQLSSDVIKYPTYLYFCYLTLFYMCYRFSNQTFQNTVHKTRGSSFNLKMKLIKSVQLNSNGPKFSDSQTDLSKQSRTWHRGHKNFHAQLI